MPKSKNKIAIISHSLGNGGAERFAGVLSLMLTNLRYEIHHIIINDSVDYPFSGSLYNLGKETEQMGSFQRKIQKGVLLKKYLKKHDIDVIIDNRTHPIFIRELIAKWIFGNRKLIAIIHSFHIESYLPKSRFLARFLYRKTQLVCVSKAIEVALRNKYDFKNVTTIYNPIESDRDLQPNINPNRYILFFGRLDEKVKNFTLMIASFVHSKVYENGVKLMIMGDGPDAAFIEKLIVDTKMEQFIQIIPFQKNPFEIVKSAYCTILTSYYEGFPLAIIESLSMGTPVIAVDCNSGPAEVITNKYNGILVPNHNVEALGSAIKLLVEDVNLYHICKQNAIKSIEHLSPANIAKQWQEILEKP